MSSKNNSPNILKNSANLIVSTATSMGKTPNLWNKIMFILIKSMFAILVASLLYYRVADGSFFGKELILFFTVTFIVWTISSYSRGQWEDHVITFIVLMLMALLYYVSWLSLENIFGLELNNPVSIGYFVIISWFAFIILISRFTYLNLVKAIGWIIGLTTIGLFVFTYSVWGTLEVCQLNKVITGIQDPFKIVAMVYLTWAILLGLTFYAEMLHHNNTKLMIFGICSLIAAAFLGYTWKRCEPAMKEMENVDETEAKKISIRNEPSWINTSSHIATIFAWFNLFIGHYVSSSFFSFVGYSILSQCAPKNDPRTLSINLLVLIYFVVGILYVVKHFLLS